MQRKVIGALVPVIFAISCLAVLAQPSDKSEQVYAPCGKEGYVAYPLTMEFLSNELHEGKRQVVAHKCDTGIYEATITGFTDFKGLPLAPTEPLSQVYHLTMHVTSVIYGPPLAEVSLSYRASFRPHQGTRVPTRNQWSWLCPKAGDSIIVVVGLVHGQAGTDGGPYAVAAVPPTYSGLSMKDVFEKLLAVGPTYFGDKRGDIILSLLKDANPILANYALYVTPLFTTEVMYPFPAESPLEKAAAGRLFLALVEASNKNANALDGELLTDFYRGLARDALGDGLVNVPGCRQKVTLGPKEVIPLVRAMNADDGKALKAKLILVQCAKETLADQFTDVDKTDIENKLTALKKVIDASESKTEESPCPGK